MAQHGDRQKRKQRQATRSGSASAPGPEPRERPAAYARSEAKNQAIRDTLEPLDEGERPLAVTIGALVSAVLAIVQLGLFLAGVEVRGEPPPFASFAFFEGLLLVMAWGMWKARYWAVLGFQALLALVILVVGLVLMTAANAQAVLVCLAVIVPAATLFWFMVKALARIQMPERS